MRRLAPLALLSLAFGCKKAGPTNFVSYDVPAASLGGMTAYAEPVPGLEMGVAEAWKGFSATAMFAATRRANPQVQGVGMDVMQHDRVLLLDYRPATGGYDYLPLLRMNAIRQKNASLDDAVRQYLPTQSASHGYRRLPDARLPGGVAAHLVGTVGARDLFEKPITVPMEVWLFASPDTLYVVQDAYRADQTSVPPDVDRMLATLRFRRPNPRGGFGNPPMPETEAGITSRPVGQMMGGRPYDESRDAPQGYGAPTMPPTFGPPQPGLSPNGSPPVGGSSGSVPPSAGSAPAPGPDAGSPAGG